MLIQINTDNNIDGNERMSRHFSDVIGNALDRFSEYITRIEAHLSDENSHKEGPADKRCMLEARVKGLPPIAVTHSADNLDQAVVGATEKMMRALDTAIARITAH